MAIEMGMSNEFIIGVHGVAAGMGGIRTAGDLVMWMQMTRRMRLAEARQYVAEKLKVDLFQKAVK
jgi:hypothetical protein